MLILTTKEGCKIRVKRLRKFSKRNWLYIFSLKLGIIFYSLTFSTLYLTGNTGAYFNDTENVNGVIQVGTWPEKWDKSSLLFLPNTKQLTNKNQCLPVKVTIKNGGDKDMHRSVNYEVWWAEKGNPKDGMKISSGEVKALKSGESLVLSLTPTKNGIYKLKAFQRPGHPGKGELWSDEIAVNCFNTKIIEEPKEVPKKTEEVEKAPEQKQKEPTQPLTPETTEEVPPTQTNETKEDIKPIDTTKSSSNAQEAQKTTTQGAINPNSQPVEQNETKKDDPK
ncbi:amyloid fiber anchoring/assembly protein TapA [Fictibacillus norfolkensis]|uniref:amyloid fiber anchoring/assembly protein TapA n=1 Tax=Fictibacillus norfolkensis TaxID=2762233 RepID=UPI00296B557A|nr:amyloid fiber anchoring/assembly protein TapA [Fictibacillus norfolkensis]